jgi:RNA polymerase-binding transcription factor DksA
MLDTSEIKKTLEARLAALIEEAKEIDSELREPLDADSMERAVELEDDEVLEEIGHNAVIEIARIRDALHRIDDGTYGVCVSCGEDIKEARLKAVPYAPTCIKCAGD